MTSLASKQPAVMAAIVTTMLWLPAGALLALFCYGVFDVSLESFLTLGHSLPHPSVGLLAWWAIGFAPAYVYAVLISAHD
ncbi:MAG TPA: hypothetical protein VG873_16365 [Burkholderiales bacterium]|nr:hypothetical protein [Burkholderiales bacterium]